MLIFPISKKFNFKLRQKEKMRSQKVKPLVNHFASVLKYFISIWKQLKFNKVAFSNNALIWCSCNNVSQLRVIGSLP